MEGPEESDSPNYTEVNKRTFSLSNGSYYTKKVSMQSVKGKEEKGAALFLNDHKADTWTIV
ncbi:hypothetical protein OUZ56_030945 [Daphnia magna]|uniref:Uncharacterized protein n=1 Tax=Daphnia magna TaxID=35525 RepID=A0ABQ9ZSR6_9CRUS|nr:hypothetical protein OUZ56_030945 [Daphnia magna]